MEQLGIDPRLLLAQIINFGLIVFVLSRVLYKPVLAFLDKRKQEIADGVALAEKMKKEEAHTQEKREKVVADARREAREIVEQAKKTAKEEATAIVEKAHKQAANVMAKGKEDVAAMKKTAEKEQRKEAIAMAEEMVMRVLPKTMNARDQHALIAKNLKEIAAV